MEIKDEPCFCAIHPATLKVCPACQGAAGGRATLKKYGTEQLARWGHEGGCPAKKKKKKSARKKAA